MGRRLSQDLFAISLLQAPDVRRKRFDNSGKVLAGTRKRICRPEPGLSYAQRYFSRSTPTSTGDEPREMRERSRLAEPWCSERCQLCDHWPTGQWKDHAT